MQIRNLFDPLSGMENFGSAILIDRFLTIWITTWRSFEKKFWIADVDKSSLSDAEPGRLEPHGMQIRRIERKEQRYDYLLDRLVPAVSLVALNLPHDVHSLDHLARQERVRNNVTRMLWKGTDRLTRGLKLFLTRQLLNKKIYGRGFLQIHPNKKPVLWIRISIHFGRLDPDPGGPKWPTKVKKLKFWCVRCSLFRDENFSCSLDVLFGGLGINKLQFLIKIIQFLFPLEIFPNFWSSNPWIQDGDPHWKKCLIRFHL